MKGLKKAIGMALALVSVVGMMNVGTTVSAACTSTYSHYSTTCMTPNCQPQDTNALYSIYLKVTNCDSGSYESAVVKSKLGCC